LRTHKSMAIDITRERIAILNKKSKSTDHRWWKTNQNFHP
jgi:hypothetical protein